MINWLKRRRRRQLLAQPIPAAWPRILRSNVAFYRYLHRDEQSRLLSDARILVAEKNWEGCGGLTLTEEMTLIIAAQAALLLLNIEHDYFGRVLSILVYPGQYQAPESWLDREITIEGESIRLGEAWYRGPVILSWDDVRHDAGQLGQGQNIVWHEFAHQLDMMDRLSDGTPPLATADQYRRWRTVMTAEYERLIEDARLGRPSILDHYGATSEAEFFAVCTETFFGCPAELRAAGPQLYQLLCEYYRQDPAVRLGG